MKKPIVRIPLKYGFFAGLLAFALVMILFYLGNTHPQLYPIFLDFRILLFGLFIYFSIREFKVMANNGTLHFWQGMVIGILCYVTAAWIASVALVALGKLDASYVANYVNETSELLIQNKEGIVEKVGQAQYDAQLNVLPSTTIFALAFDYFLKSMLMGLFLTIIISVILRKQAN
jgi:hypothetical protein